MNGRGCVPLRPSAQKQGGHSLVIPPKPAVFGDSTDEPPLQRSPLKIEITEYNDRAFVVSALGKLVTSTLLLLSLAEMWYGVFLWALVTSLFFHVPAGLLALFTLRHHKYGRFMSVSILLMGIVGPITAGILTSMLDV